MTAEPLLATSANSKVADLEKAKRDAVEKEDSNEAARLKGEIDAGNRKAVQMHAVLIVVGGALVLCSYYYGIEHIDHPAQGLWGGIYTIEPLIMVYNLSILGAAIGFLVAHWDVLKCLGAGASSSRVPGLGETSYSSATLLSSSTAGFLFWSTLWMPLCAMYLARPTAAMFWLIRFDLLAVSVCGIIFAIALWNLKGGTTLPSLQAKIGAIWLAGHCTLLDCIVWPNFFRLTAQEQS